MWRRAFLRPTALPAAVQVATIDNVDTLDLERLTWAEALPDGSVRLAGAVIL
jgi:hypothetical protein